MRPKLIWLLSLLCAAGIFSAMGVITHRSLQLEHDNAEARADAELQGRIRLALWRMETDASTLVLGENSQPPGDFHAFPPDSAQGALSPLATTSEPNVRMHFEIGRDKAVTSPEAPSGPERTRALQMGARPAALEEADRRLARLRSLLASRPDLGWCAGVVNFGTRKMEVAWDNRTVLCTAAAAPERASFVEEEKAAPPAPPPAPTKAVAVAEAPLSQAAQNSTELNFRRKAFDKIQTGGKTGSGTYNLEPQVAAAKDMPATRAARDSELAKKKSAPAQEREHRGSLVEQLQADAAAPPSAAPSVPAPPAAAAYGMNRESTAASAGAASDRAAKAVGSGPPASSLAMNSRTYAPDTARRAGTAMDAAKEPPRPGEAIGRAKMPEAVAPAPVLPAAPAAPALPAAPAGSWAEPPAQVLPFRPFWLGTELFLVREVITSTGRVVQGVWLDASSLRSSLLATAEDILPRAGLDPVQGVAFVTNAAGRLLPTTPPPVADPMALVGLPWRLVPHETAAAGLTGFTPVRVILAAAWAAAVLAAVAACALLLGVTRLSERRAAFVSSVTHELRTPLTTFRLYSEMLEQGMVGDEAQRSHYLRTLRTEAERLTHLVDNVLAYSRIERARRHSRHERLELPAWLERVTPRFAERAQECGMTLCVEVPPGAASLVAVTDATALEQILFNLIDNACKYAAGRCQEPVVRLILDRRGRWAEFRVCDTGPGIHRRERRRLFRPFHKSADEAANTKPGVGLGLALSHRLAKSLGGELFLEKANGPGACLVLRVGVE